MSCQQQFLRTPNQYEMYKCRCYKNSLALEQRAAKSTPLSVFPKHTLIHTFHTHLPLSYVTCIAFNVTLILIVFSDILFDLHTTFLKSKERNNTILCHIHTVPFTAPIIVRLYKIFFVPKNKK